MPYVLQAIDAIDQEQRQSRGEDVDGDAADDLVRPKPNRDHGMDERHEAAGDDCDQRGEPWVLKSEVGDNRKEGAGQHHAFHGDVDHATTLRDHAAERGQQQKR